MARQRRRRAADRDRDRHWPALDDRGRHEVAERWAIDRIRQDAATSPLGDDRSARIGIVERYVA
jgi:hypothetical protein